MDEPVGWRVSVEVDADDVELVSDRLFAGGALGIEERVAIHDRVLLLAGMPDEASARGAAAVLADAQVERIDDDSWADAWRAWARPVRVADVLVQPAWLPVDPGVDDASTVVTIDPGRAFGSGAHETTQLALAELLAQGRARRVLDVGCGSGVLAVTVALARGAAVVAIDIDPLAVDVTRANAERNGVAHLVETSTADIGAIEGAFDVVVANMLAVTLRELAGEFARLVAPDGVVVLSGMLAEQAASVDAACTAAGLDLVTSTTAAPWRAARYVQRGAS